MPKIYPVSLGHDKINLDICEQPLTNDIAETFKQTNTFALSLARNIAFLAGLGIIPCTYVYENKLNSVAQELALNDDSIFREVLSQME